MPAAYRRQFFLRSFTQAVPLIFNHIQFAGGNHDGVIWIRMVCILFVLTGLSASLVCVADCFLMLFVSSGSRGMNWHHRTFIMLRYWVMFEKPAGL